MRTMLKILAILLAFVTMLCGIAYFLPAVYTIEHSTEIAVEPDTCINRLRSSQTWDLWNVERSGKSTGREAILFEPDKQQIQPGVNGKFTRRAIATQISFDTIWVDECPAGSIIRWKSAVQCNFPIGRIIGLLNRNDFDTQVKQQLDAFERFMDESTLGPPVELNQEKAVEDQ